MQWQPIKACKNDGIQKLFWLKPHREYVHKGCNDNPIAHEYLGKMGEWPAIYYATHFAEVEDPFKTKQPSFLE